MVKIFAMYFPRRSVPIVFSHLWCASAARVDFLRDVWPRAVSINVRIDSETSYWIASTQPGTTGSCDLPNVWNNSVHTLDMFLVRPAVATRHNDVEYIPRLWWKCEVRPRNTLHSGSGCHVGRVKVLHLPSSLSQSVLFSTLSRKHRIPGGSLQPQQGKYVEHGAQKYPHLDTSIARCYR